MLLLPNSLLLKILFITIRFVSKIEHNILSYQTGGWLVTLVGRIQDHSLNELMCP
jgi:hypothetical protein